MKRISTPPMRRKAERRVIDTAMRDHMRLVNLGYDQNFLGGFPKKHWLACAALAKILRRKK